MKFKNYLFTLLLLSTTFVNAQTGTKHSGSMTVAGETRNYTYYVPKIYDSLNVAVPMVLNLHGFGGTGLSHSDNEDFRPIADTANFIIVHAEGLQRGLLGGVFPALGWGSMGTVADGADDHTFLLNLMDTIKANYSINSNRVYSTGFSQGGFMSSYLNAHSNHLFAAIAPISATITFDNLAASSLTHATPIMLIHGTSDGTIPYAGSDTYLSVDAMIDYWVDFNQCDPTPSLIDTVDDVNLTDNCYPIHYVYSGGIDGATIELYKIVDGDHQVPIDTVPEGLSGIYGIGNRSQDMVSSKEVWRFFSQYSLDNLTTLLVGVDESEDESNRSAIYPNPSNGYFVVELDNFTNAEVRVSNIFGEVVFDENITGVFTPIELESQAPGIYFYQVTNSNGIIDSGKLIIQ